MNVLEECLRDLDSRIDENEEATVHRAWRAFIDDRIGEGIFSAPARRPKPAGVNWPDVHINDAQDSYELMVLSQLHGVSEQLASGGTGCLGVRCNYGTGILPSLFGCRTYPMPRPTNTLPAAVPLNSPDAVRRVIEAGRPEIGNALGEKVFACARLFQDCFSKHPKLKRWVEIYHPDVQGPIDVAEVVWGSGIFLAMCDEPELVEKLLRLVTETYSEFMRAWYKLQPPENDFSMHWSCLHRGRLTLRNDSLMNLSCQTYVDLIRPFDQQLFDEFGGGMIHFCGHGDHFIERMSEMRGLSAINLTQPHLNDMEKIFSHTIDKGILLIGLEREAADSALQRSRRLHGRVQVSR